jgi:hypothetical protein
MRGRMSGMTPTTKAELMAALAENDLQFTKTVAILSGRLSDAEWLTTLNQIIGLRLVQKELEGKLAALIEEPPSDESK